MEAGPRPFFNDIQVVDKGLIVDNESHSLSVTEQQITALSDSSAVTLTLPDVSEAKGKMFSIYAPDGDTNTVTVQDNDESIEWTDIALDGDAASVLLLSDGRIWWNLSELDGTTT